MKMLQDKLITFEQSLAYAIEKTAVYYRLKGAQFFNSRNYGITLEQFCVLEILYHSKEEICQRDVSKKILKDRSNTSRFLNILEEKAFIERNVDTKQKRLVKKVKITQKGKELYELIIPEIKAEYWTSLEGVSDEEISFMKNMLEKIRNNLSKDTNIQI